MLASGPRTPPCRGEVPSAPTSLNVPMFQHPFSCFELGNVGSTVSFDALGGRSCLPPFCSTCWLELPRCDRRTQAWVKVGPEEWRGGGYGWRKGLIQISNWNESQFALPPAEVVDGARELNNAVTGAFNQATPLQLVALTTPPNKEEETRTNSVQCLKHVALVFCIHII